MPKISIQQDMCIGCGMCANVAPSVFKVNDDNVSTIIKPVNLTEEEIEQVHQAQDFCPAQGIIIED